MFAPDAAMHGVSSVCPGTVLYPVTYVST
jgi:hypothetical protein